MTTREETLAAAALAAALATARAEGREVRSMRDLICEGGCIELAVRGGLCAACDAEMSAHYVATADAHSAVTDDVDGFATDCAAAHDDPEAANYIAGLRS